MPLWLRKYDIMRKIDIKLQVSKIFLSCTLAIFALSIAIVFSLPLLVGVKFLLILVVSAYGLIFVLPEVLLKKGTSILSMSIDRTTWRIYDQLHGFSAELSGTSTVTTFVSVLRFKIPDQKKIRSCVIFRDSLPADQYRTLIVRARN